MYRSSSLNNTVKLSSLNKLMKNTSTVLIYLLHQMILTLDIFKNKIVSCYRINNYCTSNYMSLIHHKKGIYSQSKMI